MKRMLVSIFLVFQGASVLAQQPPVADDYLLALGNMLGSIRTVQYTVDICSEQFPATKPDNERALAQWRTRHHALIADVTKRFEGLPDRWAKLDAQSAKAGPESWRKLNNTLDGIRGQLKQQYEMQLGPDKFMQVCKQFQQILRSPPMDFEQVHAKEMRIVRREPAQSPG